MENRTNTLRFSIRARRRVVTFEGGLVCRVVKLEMSQVPNAEIARPIMESLLKVGE